MYKAYKNQVDGLYIFVVYKALSRRGLVCSVSAH